MTLKLEEEYIEEGVNYPEVTTFELKKISDYTGFTLPEVTTAQDTNITLNSAQCGGNATEDSLRVLLLLEFVGAIYQYRNWMQRPCSIQRILS
jgi:hypothetical protein